MGLLEELQRKLEEAARQAQQPGSGGNVNTDEIPNPWDQQPQQPQQQQAPNFPPGYQQPQQQAPNQQQYQQQYQAIMQQIQQLVGQVYQLGYQYGVQLAQSGYRSGLKIQSAAQVRVTHPDRIIRHAVHGMLPKNHLAIQMMRRLKVYAGPEHPHAAQKPVSL